MIKKIVILTFFFTLQINAQFREKTLVYGSYESCLGTYNGIDFNINYVNNKYSIRVGYSGFFRHAINAPNDFREDIFGANETVSSVHLVYGRIYSLNKKNSIQLNVGSGLAYLSIAIPYNFTEDGGLLAFYNYRWENNIYKEFGFVVNPKVEFLLRQTFGVTASPLFQYSKHSTYLGLGIGVMFRLIKKRK